jgi:hypothetical protein
MRPHLWHRNKYYELLSKADRLAISSNNSGANHAIGVV